MLSWLGRDRRYSSKIWCGLVSVVAFALAVTVALEQPCAWAQSSSPLSSQASPSVPTWQKAAGGATEFEVASIRPAAPGAQWRTNIDLSVEDSPVPPGGRFSATATLGTYIQFAYKLSLIQKQVVFARVPKWVTTDLFDIEAKAASTDPTNDQLRLMMRALLADRFKLAAHFETHDVPVMALMLIKPGNLGPRLRPHSEGPACDAKIPPVDHSSPKIPDVWMPVCNLTNLVDWANHTVILGSRNTTMEIFADYVPTLERFDRLIVDQTGLTGRFDIELYFTPYWVMPKDLGAEAQLDYSGPTFLEAVRNQLGLKLAPSHASVQTLVIDHIEQPTPN